MSNPQPHSDTEIMIILKYGSMWEAFRVWLTDTDNSFSWEENKALVKYTTEELPRLIEKVDK